MANPLVTIVAATYNRAPLLRENIASILAQEGDAWEAVYVDDGSTDETPEVLDAHAKAHPARFRYIRIVNQGPGPARNAGVKLARGEYILFTDDDATAPPDWVSHMLDCRASHGCDVLCGGIAPFSLETPAERYMHYRFQKSLGAYPKPIKAAPTLNLLLPTVLFHKVGGFREERLTAAEDWDLCLRMAATGARMFYDPAVCVTHRYSRDWDAAAARIRAMGEMGLRVCAEHHGHPAAYVAYSMARFMASPIWIPWHYPLDLYGAVLRMEALFAWSRAKAFLHR